jgi:pimeloyl-ACP methyl ester carboxylesterase
LKLHNYPRLKQINARTLVVTGADDVLIPARSSELMAADIPGAQLLIIPGVGHNFLTPAHEFFLAGFTPFLKAHSMGINRSANP